MKYASVSLLIMPCATASAAVILTHTSEPSCRARGNSVSSYLATRYRATALISRHLRSDAVLTSNLEWRLFSGLTKCSISAIWNSLTPQPDQSVRRCNASVQTEHAAGLDAAQFRYGTRDRSAQRRTACGRRCSPAGDGSSRRYPAPSPDAGSYGVCTCQREVYYATEGAIPLALVHDLLAVLALLVVVVLLARRADSGPEHQVERVRIRQRVACNTRFVSRFATEQGRVR